jgi:hypothetical protein
MELGQNVRALSEFQAALSLGCRHWRTSWYLAQTAARLQVSELVLSSLREVIQTAPEFADAEGMLRRWEQGVASE